ncbi:MAG TPA: NUDIX hydrolase [Flavisolibacter sp.]
MNGKNLLEEAVQLKSIADVGLLYCTNEYDRERYLAIAEISLRLLNDLSQHPMELLREAFPLAKDYPTAKVDIRGLILSPEKEVLLVKEGADKRWSLPGGWADIGYSPKETIIKECKEETGLDVIPERLLAVFDKSKHNHPPQPEYVYKMVFLCKPVSFILQKGHDVLDVKYFPVSGLPQLSENRILKSQIELVYQKVKEESTAYFD